MPKQGKLFYFPLRLSSELDRLFDELIHRPWGLPRELREWNPSVDLYETSDSFILEVDLPGVGKEDAKVELEGNILILSGRRSFEQIQDEGKFYCQERRFGEFVRRIALPEFVEKDKIHAEFKDGVLRVVLPKIRNGRGE